MNVLLFGATGMIGGGTLRECLDDPRVTTVTAVGRRPPGLTHPKLRDVVHTDFGNLAPLGPVFAQTDACFFCLGISAAGKSEAEYSKITYDIPLAVARALVTARPDATFSYISGRGADSTEKGAIMWARVKGRIENALFGLPFRGVYILRPGIIQPTRGVRSSTGWYQAFYTVTAPILPLLREAMPGFVTSTDRIGRALIELAATRPPSRIVDSVDVNRIATASSG
ncbi:MAG TPA: hypothetical protein VE967_01675 [Gemmatimonadaceae bacterium]|nr:hypothetical protein [Gemmatimonadaceae bacterium]